ncbi:hypothetical protein F511_39636 [Dorcoceras hygrometricum]|uniref:Uncharacterized protein n=1 Tax=Dorcoceras hygrometricum TaxID=472368 RepID=A0A2Z7BID2_9LAMI|nr:hypothetical protein F511_39636 [Dorcoceras hygrometricum]
MSLFDLQDVCIAIGSIATLDLPMVVDLIGIYGLKGPYRMLTTTDWFLQELSVIPRGSWGDVARRFTMIRWAVLAASLLSTHTPPPPRVAGIRSGQLDEENPFVQNSSALLVQPDEGVSVLVVDRIGDNLPHSTEKSRILVIPVGARHKCQQAQNRRPSSLKQAAAAADLRRKFVSGQFDEENPFVQNSSVLLVQPDEGVSVLVVDRIGDYLPQSTQKSRVLVILVGARHKCQQVHLIEETGRYPNWNSEGTPKLNCAHVIKVKKSLQRIKSQMTQSTYASEDFSERLQLCVQRINPGRGFINRRNETE